MSIKVLLTTVYKRTKWDYYDYFQTNASTLWRPFQFRTISYGLRFLKQNIPEIEILEYPTWEEYVNKLKEGWDVVGFSFYLNEITEILQMAQEARKQGIKELWAGNYGALTEGIESYFDRIFIGYAEHQVAEVFGKKIDEIIHPPLMMTIRLGPMKFKYMPFGVLFTERGCPIGCNFCQTPVFCPHISRISLNSIERVLNFYKKMGIRQLMILDENFGIFRQHVERVIDMIAEKGFYWWVMARADQVARNIDSWVERGFNSGFIGIESLFQPTLNRVGKKETVDVIKEAVERMHRYNCYVGGYYIIGFEEDTEESIKEGIKELAKLDLEYNQVTILTPLPRTKMWYEIDEKYGIFEKDWRKYDMKHLVWHHPTLSPLKMKQLLTWAFKELNKPIDYLRSIKRLSHLYIKGEGNLIKGWKYLLWDTPKKGLFFDDKDKKMKYFL